MKKTELAKKAEVVVPTLRLPRRSKEEIRQEVVELLLMDKRTSPTAVVERLGELMGARKAMVAGTEMMEVLDNSTRVAAVTAVMKAYGVGSDTTVEVDARKVVLNISVEDREKLGRIVRELRVMNEELMGGGGQSGEVIKKERGEE